MKALTLTEPWASLMRIGEKNIETRSWATAYRGPLAIHAAKSMPPYAKQFCDDPLVFSAFHRHEERSDWKSFHLGYVICVRNLIDIIPVDKVWQTISFEEFRFGDYTSGRFAWIFDESVKLITPPVPVRGMLSVWEWKQYPEVNP